MSQQMYYQPPRWFFGLAGYTAIALIGFFTLLNVQPWLSAAKFLAGGAINVIPFGSALAALPVVGSVISWAIANVLMLGGVVVWGVVQAIQVAPLFVARPAPLRRLQNRAEQYQRYRPNGNAAQRIDDRLDKALTAELDMLDNWRGTAYLAEFVVCLFYYPIYSDGTQALVDDILAMDLQADLVNYQQLIMVLVTMLGFEALVKIALALFAIGGHK